jgi:hypothetical protein
MPDRSGIAKLIAQMQIARDLSELQIEQLAAQSEMVRVEPNWQIRRDNLHGRRLFLVDGNARCRYEEHEHQINSRLRVDQPVELFARGQGDSDVVLAESTCLLLRFPASALGKALRSLRR